MQTDEPLPALPLEYYQQTPGPWRGIVRWTAWGALAYSVITIAAAVPGIVFYISPSWIGSSRVMLIGFPNFVLLILSIPAAGFLLAAAITLLRGSRAGRPMLLGACLAMIAQSLCKLGFFVYMSAQRNVGSMGSGFVMYQTLSQFFSLLNSSFVPMALLLIFCRREIKEATGAGG